MNKKINHPAMKILKESLVNLPTPTSISYMWNWGSMLGLALMIQIISGILLSSHYNPSVEKAFYSIIHITRDTNFGFELRFIHMNMASLFFICIFIHISRSLLMSSFKMHYTWVSGVTMLLILMGTAFLGYVLPWGQMSFWGATVITNLLSAIPYLGGEMVKWLWGGFSIDDATLNRFFSLHFLMPFLLSFMVIMHLASLHMTGSSKPVGMNPNKDKIPFHPFFSSKDLTPIMILMWVMLYVSFKAPFVLGDPENFNMANPLNTPIHIQPEWYFLFAYAILRSIPNKLGGVMALVMSIVLLAPLLKMKKLKSSKKLMPNMKSSFWMFSAAFLILTFVGAKPVEEPYEDSGKMVSMIYFLLMYSN